MSIHENETRWTVNLGGLFFPFRTPKTSCSPYNFFPTTMHVLRTILAHIRVPLSFATPNASSSVGFYSNLLVRTLSLTSSSRRKDCFVRMSKYTAVEKGVPNSTNYRVFFSEYRRFNRILWIWSYIRKRIYLRFQCVAVSLNSYQFVD